jgi:subtilisin-like proprotein convertase family protein
MKTLLTVTFLAVSLLACPFGLAQLSASHSWPANLPIPPSGTGAAGGCGSGSPNTTQLVVQVPETFKLTHVRCEITLTHSYVGDLTIRLGHCGGIVTLYDRMPGGGNDLNGTYAFEDSAILSFANAVSGPGPVVPPNTYLPVNPLSALNGLSSAGDWYLQICDQAGGDVGQLTGLSLVLDGAQSFGGGILPGAAIPDGNNGCVAPLVRTINVPTPGVVDAVTVMIGINHTYVRDLDISIAHDGVVVMLSGAQSIQPDVGVQGLYIFSSPNGFTQTFDSAAAATPANANVPPGTYLPDQPLAAFAGHSQQGLWVLTICDTAAQDVGTLSAFSIHFSSSAYDLHVEQYSGPVDILLVNLGGSPGNYFVNLVTLVPGNFPNGWLNGLDIAVSAITWQVSLGEPFFGTLDSCGSHASFVTGPIPSGIPVQIVSFELDPNGSVVGSVPAFQHVTL